MCKLSGKEEKPGIIYAGWRMGKEWYLEHEQNVESKELAKRKEKQSKE